MRKKRLTKAVQGLDPGSRALLDLSLRRRVPDDEIADFLGIDAASVARRRASALRRLGNDLEIERPEELTRMLVALAALPADAWGVPARPGEAGPVEQPEGRTVEVGGDRQRRRAVVIAGVPITALGVLVAMIIAAGGDETLMETGRVQGDSRPAPPLLGEVPTPRADDTTKGSDRRGSGGGGGTAVASTAVAPSEAAPPESEPEVRVEGRQEGEPEDGDERTPRARAPELAPAPAPAPAPQAPTPQAAPAPAPAPPPGGGDDGEDNPDPRAPTQGPANGPLLPVPNLPEAPRPPKPPDDGGDDDGDDGDGGSTPQPAPLQPAQPQDGGGKNFWKRLKGKQKKQSPPKAKSDGDGDTGDRSKPRKRGRKRGDD